MMFTSCPECSRQFRVRARQLAAAEGLVQCGYCGKQFNALDRLYDKPVAVDAVSSAAGGPDKPEVISPLLDEAPSQPEIAEPAVAEAEPIFKAAEVIDSEEPQFDIPEQEEADSQAGPTFLPATEPEDDLVNFDLSETESAFRDAGLSAEDLPESEEEAVLQFTNQSTGTSVIEPIEDEDAFAVDPDINDSLKSENPAPEPVIADSAGSEYSFPEELIEEEETGPGWTSRLLWTLGVLLLVTAGTAQAAWFNRDILLSRYPELMPYAKRVCHQFQCTLIRNRNVSAIKLINRDVRVHPRYEDALLVNATITNLSKYTQRFPIVLLTLYDPNGDVMAYRKIPPADYLDESIDIEAGMASNAPIHFVFELANESRDAVSFEFDFL